MGSIPVGDSENYFSEYFYLRTLLHYLLLDHDLLEDNEKFSNPMIYKVKRLQKLCTGTFVENVKTNAHAIKKGLPALSPRQCFHVYIINK